MINTDILVPRFEALNEYLSILRKIARYSQKEFLENPERYGAAERFLQLSIEALNDIGSHIIADQQLGTIATYSDIPRILCESQIVSPELAEKWRKIIGFRNILVHEYLKLDRTIIYTVLTNHLTDLAALETCLALQL